MRSGADTTVHHLEPDRRALARLWLAEHSIVPVLILVSVLLGLGFAARYVPVGPAEEVVGTVKNVVLVATGRYSSDRLVYVNLGSEAVAVHGLPRDCSVGDRILLRRQRMLWGYSLSAISCGFQLRDTSA